MITAVTFDFWNTIAHIPPDTMAEVRRRAVTRACEGCGVRVEAERVTVGLEEVAHQYRRFWERGRHFHPQEGAAMLAGRLGIEDDARRSVAEAFLEAGREADLIPAPSLEPCLKALRAQGVRLGIVSDVVFTRSELLREQLEEKGLLEYFSGWGFSDEVGHYKPASEIFDAALEMLEARPEEAMHVGDLHRTDVAGAAAHGMTTTRYRGLYDDPKVEGALEAEFVIANHLELAEIVERLCRERGG